VGEARTSQQLVLDLPHGAGEERAQQRGRVLGQARDVQDARVPPGQRVSNRHTEARESLQRLEVVLVTVHCNATPQFERFSRDRGSVSTTSARSITEPGSRPLDAARRHDDAISGLSPGST
jgi:hypothetical protein